MPLFITSFVLFPRCFYRLLMPGFNPWWDLECGKLSSFLLFHAFWVMGHLWRVKCSSFSAWVSRYLITGSAGSCCSLKELLRLWPSFWHWVWVHNWLCINSRGTTLEINMLHKIIKLMHIEWTTKEENFGFILYRPSADLIEFLPSRSNRPNPYIVHDSAFLFSILWCHRQLILLLSRFMWVIQNFDIWSS